MNTSQKGQEQATSDVITALANHGIVARASVAGGVTLTLAMAQNLVAILEDLKRIEERGSV